MKIKEITLCFLFLGLLPLVTKAQETAPAKTSAPQIQETTLDTTDILDKAEEFSSSKAEFENQIVTLKKNDFSENTFEKLKERFETQQNLFIKSRLLSSWDITRATDFKNLSKELFSDTESLKKKYVDFLKKTDELKKNLGNSKILFKKYLAKIRSETDLEGQKDLLGGLIKNIDDYLGQIKTTRDDVVQKYEPNISLIDKISKFQNTVQNEIDYFKQERFHKTAPAFYETHFFAQFTSGLSGEIILNTKQACQWDLETIQRHLTEMIPVLLLFLVLLFSLKKLESVAGADMQKLPLLLALAIMWLMVPTLIRDPLPIENIFFWIIAAILFFLLLRHIPSGANEQKDIRVLLVLYTLLSLIDIIGLPVPLYRAFIGVLGFGASLYCFRRLDSCTASSWLFRLTLQILAVLFFAAAMAELLGYHLLAVLLINGSTKSAFLIFALWNLRHYFLKIITSVLNIEGLQNFNIIQKYRFLVYEKIKFVLHTLMGFIVLLALGKFWGFADSFAEAFENLWNISLNFGEQKITLGMLLSATLAFYLVHLVSFFTRHFLEDDVYPRQNISAGAGKSINSLIHYSAWIISIFLAFVLLGFEIKQFAIIAGALSVGLGFGLQNIVNNFVSGLILLFERPIKVGDTLDIDGEWGTVEKVGLRSTIIRSSSKTQLILPNSEFISKKVKNLTLSDPDYRVVIPVNVAYGSDLNLVKNILLEIANKHPEIDHKTQPKIYFSGFGENALNLEIWFWTNNVNLKHDIISDFLFKIDEEFRQNGVKIPFPQREIHLLS